MSREFFFDLTNFKKTSSLPEPIHMDIYNQLAIKNPLKDIMYSAWCSKGGGNGRELKKT